MNIVINNLIWPCDLKYVINSFLYDNLGYSYEELQEIKKSKKSQEIIKLRQEIELYYWKSTGCSVSWLKPTSTTSSGAYLNKGHEQSMIFDLRNTISNDNFVDLIRILNIEMNL